MNKLAIIITLFFFMSNLTSQELGFKKVNICGSVFKLSSQEMIEDKCNHCFKEEKRLEIIECIYSIVANSEFTLLINSLKKHEDELMGFGMMKLLDDFAERTIQDINVREVFKLSILEELGYDALLAYNSNMITLYVMSEEDIILSNYHIGGRSFYCFETSSVSSEGYSIFNPAKNLGIAKSLDFSLGNSGIKNNGSLSEKVISFKFRENDITLNYSIDESVLCRAEEIPMFDLGKLYIEDESQLRYLITEIKKKASSLNLKKENDIVLFLLNLVQSGISYSYDEVNDYFFPIETMCFGHGDCEDKSILFSYLIKTILSKRTILLVYNNHINVGILADFDNDLNKEFCYSHNGEKYFVCEPTGGLTTDSFIHKFDFEPESIIDVIELF